MKHAGVIHAPAKSGASIGVPRGWVVVGAAIAAWLVVLAIGYLILQLFGVLGPLF